MTFAFINRREKNSKIKLKLLKQLGNAIFKITNYCLAEAFLEIHSGFNICPIFVPHLFNILPVTPRIINAVIKPQHWDTHHTSEKTVLTLRQSESWTVGCEIWHTALLFCRLLFLLSFECPLMSRQSFSAVATSTIFSICISLHTIRTITITYHNDINDVFSLLCHYMHAQSCAPFEVTVSLTEGRGNTSHAYF